MSSNLGKTKDDEDPLTLDQMRGYTRELSKANMSVAEKATVKGVMTELDIVKQKLEKAHEQMRTLIGLYGTLRNEFDGFKANHVATLNLKVNGGSTTPSDME